MFTGHRPLQLTRTSILHLYYKQFKSSIKMNCFIVLHLTAIVAITMEKCNGEYLLVAVEDDDDFIKPKNDDLRKDDDDFKKPKNDDFRGKLN